jgi:hypothetical protein
VGGGCLHELGVLPRRVLHQLTVAVVLKVRYLVDTATVLEFVVVVRALAALAALLGSRPRATTSCTRQDHIVLVLLVQHTVAIIVLHCVVPH